MGIPVSLEDFAGVKVAPAEKSEVKPKSKEKELTKSEYIKDVIIPVLEMITLICFLIMIVLFLILCVIGNIGTPTETVKGFVLFIDNHWKGSLFIAGVLLYRPILLKIEQLKILSLEKLKMEFLIKGKK